MRHDRTYTNTGPKQRLQQLTWAPEGNKRRGRPKTNWRRKVEKERKKAA